MNVGAVDLHSVVRGQGVAAPDERQGGYAGGGGGPGAKEAGGGGGVAGDVVGVAL